jgi:serralysin
VTAPLTNADRSAAPTTHDSVGSRIYGRGGGDALLGGDGNDELHGGAGHDQISGDRGRDLIWGDGGDDELGDTSSWPASSDVYQGGAGIDTVSYVNYPKAITVDADGVTGDDGAKGEKDTIALLFG